MIAFFGFFNARDVGFEIVFVCPCCAVDALQLLVVAIAAPVCARHFGELEIFEETGVGNVRPAAHIHIFLVVIHAHGGDVVCHVVNQAQFVVFAALFKDFNHFGARRHFFDDIVVLVNQLFHARFNGGDVFGRERFFAENVVVKAVFDHRADDHFYAGEQLFHRMPNQVRTRVADDFYAFGVFGGDDLHAGVFGNRVAGIAQNAVYFACYGGFCQPCADVGGDLGDGGGGFVLAD